MLKVLIVMKLVKHKNVFIYYTKYKSSSVPLQETGQKIKSKAGR